MSLSGCWIDHPRKLLSHSLTSLIECLFFFHEKNSQFSFVRVDRCVIVDANFLFFRWKPALLLKNASYAAPGWGTEFTSFAIFPITSRD